MILSRAVHLRRSHSSSKPRVPEFRLGEFEQRRLNIDLESASMNVGLDGWFYLASNQMNTVNHLGMIRSSDRVCLGGGELNEDGGMPGSNHCGTGARRTGCAVYRALVHST